MEITKADILNKAIRKNESVVSLKLDLPIFKKEQEIEIWDFLENDELDNFTYRIDQHINKAFIKSFTAKADDWQLYFYRDYLTYVQARSIETHIKKMRNSLYMENLKKHPEIIEKLILKYRE